MDVLDGELRVLLGAKSSKTVGRKQKLSEA